VGLVAAEITSQWPGCDGSAITKQHIVETEEGPARELAGQRLVSELCRSFCIQMRHSEAANEDHEHLELLSSLISDVDELHRICFQGSLPIACLFFFLPKCCLNLCYDCGRSTSLMICLPRPARLMTRRGRSRTSSQSQCRTLTEPSRSSQRLLFRTMGSTCLESATTTSPFESGAESRLSLLAKVTIRLRLVSTKSVLRPATRTWRLDIQPRRSRPMILSLPSAMEVSLHYTEYEAAASMLKGPNMYSLPRPARLMTAKYTRRE